MIPFRPKGRTMYECKVPTSSGWIKRPTKTRDRATARKMAQMVEQLGPSNLRAFDLLDEVRDGRLTLPLLWDLWVRHGGDVTAIRYEWEDTDLLSKVPIFEY